MRTFQESSSVQLMQREPISKSGGRRTLSRYSPDRSLIHT